MIELIFIVLTERNEKYGKTKKGPHFFSQRAIKKNQRDLSPFNFPLPLESLYVI